MISKNSFQNKKTSSNFFSIPPGSPFLLTFIQSLIKGDILKSFDINDQDTLKDTIIYVPTQRSARTLRSLFFKINPKKSLILPQISSLGNINKNFFLEGKINSKIFNFPINEIDQLLIFSRLIYHWKKNLKFPLKGQINNTKFQHRISNSIWMAYDLMRCINEIERQEINWNDIYRANCENTSEWRKITKKFLNIIIKNLPKILNEKNTVTPIVWCNQIIRSQIQNFSQNITTPVISLGITGSLPITESLLKTIASLPKGAIVFQGLDRDLDCDSWNSLNENISDPSSFSHPQYGFKKLLKRLNIERININYLGNISSKKRYREMVISKSFQPIVKNNLLINLNNNKINKAFSNVSLIEASNEQEEALSVAIALRCAIKNNHKTAALISNDRTFIRRVCCELNRFGLRANISGGVPLSESKQATLIKLLLECIFHKNNPITLLSLLKHPLVKMQRKPNDYRKIIDWIELFVLREHQKKISLKTLHSCISKTLKILKENKNSPSKVSHKLINKLNCFGQELINFSLPLYDFFSIKGLVSIRKATIATVKTFENFGKDDKNSMENLYSEESGKKMIEFLKLLISENSGLNFSPREWIDIFTALLAEKIIIKEERGNPRIQIWGSFEARLQEVDTIIISGLNEGIFPKIIRQDPFLPCSIRSKIGLEPLERYSGISAYDFQMSLGMNNVIISRSLKVKNTLSIPSRWLQRIKIILDKKSLEDILKRGNQYIFWSRNIDNNKKIELSSRPEPKPPLEYRPRNFSVTEIEVLRRDPYSIYAKKILKLKPLNPLIRNFSYAERGTLYHSIFSHLPNIDVGLDIKVAKFQFLQIAKKKFKEFQIPSSVEIFWWEQFKKIILEILILEKKFGKRIRLSEVSSKRIFIDNTNVEISGRADRIDLINSYDADIIDFKTGSTPSIKQAENLTNPQLALEGALLTKGAFQCGIKIPNDLLFVRLTSKNHIKCQSIKKISNKKILELIEEAWNRLKDLISYYQDKNVGYVSYFLPKIGNYEGEYDHLARVLEWSEEIINNEF